MNFAGKKMQTNFIFICKHSFRIKYDTNAKKMTIKKLNFMFQCNRLDGQNCVDDLGLESSRFFILFDFSFSEVLSILEFLFSELEFRNMRTFYFIHNKWTSRIRIRILFRQGNLHNNSIN